MASTALRISDRIGTPQASRTPAAAPSESGTCAPSNAAVHSTRRTAGSQPELILRGTVSEQGQTIVKHLGTFV